ncbi:MAG: hypothetical protein V7731_19000 [Amphritea sp.]
MKLKPIYTLLLMLLLLAGQLSAAAEQPVGVFMPAMQMTLDMGEAGDIECGEDCVMADSACPDNCMVELSGCAQAQTAVFLPASIAVGDLSVERLFTERISAYHYQSLPSIYHPPQSPIAL